MKRTGIALALAALVLGQTGCASCKKLFGLDKRCESPPPQQYYSAPVVSGPVSYSPAPSTCNSPKP